MNIAFNKKKVSPGDEVELEVTAYKDSYVGLLAVDKSVRLMQEGNDITKNQVKSKIVISIL